MDRPIIFSAPMVRAMLRGEKTQTRRVLRKPMPEAPAMDAIHPSHQPKHAAPYFDAYCGLPRTKLNPRGMSDYWCWWTRDDREGQGLRVGYAPGDRLWVREAAAIRSHGWNIDTGHSHGRDYAADHDESEAMILDLPRCGSGIWNSKAPSVFPRKSHRANGRLAWCPSIHMPRWASRMTLLVSNVRVQRLQAITEEDAIAEGMREPTLSTMGGIMAQAAWSERQIFSRLWDHLHGADAWDANPWVVALTFELVRQNIDQLAVAA